MEGNAGRGEYIFHAAGCASCHTDIKHKGPPLAGGRALVTPFGTFYSPNITPDREHGIGAWSEADFVKALRQGRAPDGSAYYPAFPYPSYTAMRDDDIRDLWAFLRTQPAVDKPNHEHDLRFPFGWRPLVRIWQFLFLEEGPRPEADAKSAEWRRGAYLVRAVGHCGECHSPRNLLGAIEDARALSGNPDGPDGRRVPNITPGGKDIRDWSVKAIASYLGTGVTPDGDFVGGAMVEVIENSTSKLTDADRQAIATYLESLPPRD